MIKFDVSTQRLGLQRVTNQHWDELKRILQDEELMHFSVKGVKTDQEVLHYIKQSQSDEEEGDGQYTLYSLETGEFIGIAGYFSFLYEEAKELEINYRILRSHWRRGYATEVAIFLADQAFERLGKQRVFAIVDQRNLASKRVLEKAGFECEGKFQYHGRATFLYQKKL